MTDWFRMLHELKCAGVANSTVAKRLGLHNNAILSWKNGITQPRFDHAVNFIMLYCEVVKPTDCQLIVSTSAYKLVVTPAMV